MPELPEVENVARALQQSLLGRQLTAVEVRWSGVLSQTPGELRRAVVGKTLSGIHRHGKYLLLHFRGGRRRRSRSVPGAAPRGAEKSAAAYLMIHLRMTGQLFARPGYRPDKHVHLVLDFEGLRVYYRDIRKFGRFTLVEHGSSPRALSHVGPDFLAIRFREWHPLVASRHAPIKSVLLDQRTGAGLGNIYADEALHRAGIHPALAPADLDREELRRVLRSAKAVLRQAIRHGGTTYLSFVDFQGRPGNFRDKLRVYGRTGDACRTCGTVIAREVLGGRSSHYCPRCQPFRRGKRRRNSHVDL
jgi:formamidopyrimidine-DNA glycosylase